MGFDDKSVTKQQKINVFTFCNSRFEKNIYFCALNIAL